MDVRIPRIGAVDANKPLTLKLIAGNLTGSVGEIVDAVFTSEGRTVQTHHVLPSGPLRPATEGLPVHPHATAVDDNSATSVVRCDVLRQSRRVLKGGVPSILDVVVHLLLTPLILTVVDGALISERIQHLFSDLVSGAVAGVVDES